LSNSFSWVAGPALWFLVTLQGAGLYFKIRGYLLMIVIQTYTKDAEQFAGITTDIDFETLKKRLRIYYKNVGEIKARLYAGEKISMPCVTIQKDRRVRDLPIKNERRSVLKL